MGCRLQTVLDRLHPTNVPEDPWGGYLVPRAFEEGNLVFARNYGGEPSWLPG